MLHFNIHIVCLLCNHYNIYDDDHTNLICVGKTEAFWDRSAKDAIGIKTKTYLSLYILYFKMNVCSAHQNSCSSDAEVTP
jgi:hypothetical protein